MSLKLTQEGDKFSYNKVERALKRGQSSPKHLQGALIRVSKALQATIREC
jgi:hypothetical protein